MRLDIAERLLCPMAHDPSPLIILADRVEGRDLQSGTAACARCSLEARIVDGDIRFGPAAGALAASPGDESDVRRDLDLDLERTRALLGLAEPDGFILLTGRYSVIAPDLARLAEVEVVTFGSSAPNGPESDHDREEGTGHAHPELVSAVRGSPQRIPFADETFRAAALDGHLPEQIVHDAVRTVVVGGRLIGVATLPVPRGVRELARDDHEWVAERVPMLPLVSVGRRPRQSPPVS